MRYACICRHTYNQLWSPGGDFFLFDSKNCPIFMFFNRVKFLTIQNTDLATYLLQDFCHITFILESQRPHL